MISISSIQNTCLKSIFCSVPENVIDNYKFAQEHFEEDLSSIIAALGIVRRHICVSRESTSLTLAVDSAKRMFNNLDYDVSNLGAIVFITLTPDSLMPNNASAAHSLLGLPANCAAFDINHACSGYVYGLWIASLMSNNLKKDVLLLDADTNSYYTSKKDKATGLLFGDAGSASLITYCKEPSENKFCFFTDGEHRDSLTLPGFGFKKPLTEESLRYKSYEDKSIRRDIDMYMDGEAVFDYVVSRVPKQVRLFLDEIEMEPEEYKWLILHQANAFMLRQMARRIGFKKDQLLYSIQEYGNTSSVSIPLTIVHNSDRDLAANNLFIGMGAGLSTGIASINLSMLDRLDLHHGDF